MDYLHVKADKPCFNYNFNYNFHDPIQLRVAMKLCHHLVHLQVQ